MDGDIVIYRFIYIKVFDFFVFKIIGFFLWTEFIGCFYIVFR